MFIFAKEDYVLESVCLIFPAAS